MSKGAQILDYHNYAVFMRKALSGSEICNQDGTLNHLYFNTKKGFYWSDQHNELLKQGLVKFGTDWAQIRQTVFLNAKTQVEIELRACLLLGVKEPSKITEKQISQIAKAPAKSSQKANGNSASKKK